MDFCINGWNIERQANYSFPSPNYMLRLIISKGYYILIASLLKGKITLFSIRYDHVIAHALFRIRRENHARKRPQTPGWFRTTRNQEF